MKVVQPVGCSTLTAPALRRGWRRWRNRKGVRSGVLSGEIDIEAAPRIVAIARDALASATVIDLVVDASADVAAADRVL